MRDLITDKIRADFEEIAHNVYKDQKIALLKRRDDATNPSYPPFCITYSNEKDEKGNYVNDQLCTWMHNLQGAIECYTECYGGLFRRRNKK